MRWVVLVGWVVVGLFGLNNPFVPTSKILFPTFCRALSFSVRDEMFGNRIGCCSRTHFLLVCSTRVAAQSVHTVYISMGLVTFASSASGNECPGLIQEPVLDNHFPDADI